MMDYQAFSQAFATQPQAAGLAPNTEAFNAAMNQWIDAAMQQLGASSWETMPNFAGLPPQLMGQALSEIGTKGPRAGAEWLVGQVGEDKLDSDLAGFVAKQMPDVYEVQAAPETSSVPLEQGLLDQSLPSMLNDATSDEGRRNIAAQLSQQALAGSTAATNQLARTQGGGFDGKTYFAQYPDVAAAYERQGGKDGNGVAQTVDQFAEAHYLSNGQREGRKPAYVQSAQLAQDFANADRTTDANIGAANQSLQSQLGALNDATGAMRQNLTGALAEKAAALQQQIASLNQNLTQLDATQRKALTDQIAAMQQNLETEVASQRTALQSQVTALQGSATAEAQAQRTALEAEIAGLTAAQAPLADARMKAAELQATAVNVGLERTKDQLTANAAKAGYVGGSTVQDAALARATIDARQRAGEAVGSASVANASDTRDIGARGATGQRSISDALAAATRGVTNYGANTEYGLATNAASGRRQIGDLGASGVAGITNNTALGTRAIGDYGAGTTFNDRVVGANDRRSIDDALAQGTFGLKATNAQQVQGAQNAGNAAKATYYDGDYGRSLSAALAMPQIAASTAGALTTLDNYGQSGLARTQGLLNWWNTNSGAAPTPGSVAVQPSTAGNNISNLGAGLVGAGLNIGSANQWWKSPTTSTPVKAAMPSYNTAGSLPGYS